jgi:heme exporter protein D
MTLEHFFSMGGYAFYVWTSYGIALAVLLLNVILPLRRNAWVRKDIARALRQESARQERARP